MVNTITFPYNLTLVKYENLIHRVLNTTRKKIIFAHIENQNKALDLFYSEE